MIEVIHGDCLEVMEGMPDASVHACVTDPPYFRAIDSKWDRQWASAGDFLNWLGEVLAEIQRLLVPNGSLYLFASPRMAARVECKVAEYFEVLNHITWRKGRTGLRSMERSKGCDPGSLRAFFPETERIIFAEHFGADSMALGESGYAAQCEKLRGFVFEPLRAYIAGEWKRAGLTAKDANIATNSQMSSHYMTQTQWTLPTNEKYEQLRDYANANGGDYLRREYEDLRREYEDLRREYEDLRRPFVAPQQFTDLWEFDPVLAYDGKHPCEKPIALMAHIIETSTLPGQTVLDPFSGSGTTLLSAERLGRNAIGIDCEPEYVEMARRRINAETPSLFSPNP